MSHPYGHTPIFLIVSLKMNSFWPSILGYTHALTVVLCYAVGLANGICVRRAPVDLHEKRRKRLVFITIMIASSYFAEAVYYAIHHGPSVPQPTTFHAISTAIVWTAMALTQLSKEPYLFAYIGAFIVEGLFQVVVFILFRFWLPRGVLFSSIRGGIYVASASYIWRISRFSREQGNMDEETFPLIANSGTGRDQSNAWPAFKESILLCLRVKDDRQFTFCVTARFVILLAGRFINLAIPRELGIIADRIVPQSGIMPWTNITALAGYYLLDGILDSVDTYASAYLQSSAYFSISSVAFSHIMRLSTDFHTDENSAEINKSIDQAQSLGTIVDEIFFGLVPTLLDIAIALAYLAPKFGAYMALLVVSFILFYGLVGRLGIEWTKPKRTQWVENIRKASHTSTETLRLHEMVISFNQIPFQCARFERYLKATIESYLGYTCLFAIQNFLQDIISDQGLVIGCAFVIWHIVCHSSSLGSFVSFISYWKNITSPTKRMVTSYQSMSTALVDAERTLQLLRKQPSVRDEGKEELRSGKFKIKFRNVSFSYDRKAILKGLTFTAEANQTTAIVGLSGSGKTTILRLILRLFDPNEGEITIDGRELSSISLSSLREAIGTVHQHPELFNISIADNVQMGENFCQADIEMACRKACIHDEIVSFPDGYGSIVGEGGVRLSGGQRQRIAIARIILRNPSIILLDEATSAVDNITEQGIQEALRSLASRRTTVIVAHRMSTVTKADKIVVVEDGRIIDQGTHSELLKRKGLYKELWETSKVSCKEDDRFVFEPERTE